MADDKKRRQDPADLWLGKEMRHVRKRRGLSLEEVARRAELSIGLVSQIERGLSSPSIRSLRALSDALGIPASWFFQNGGPVPESERGIVTRPENRRLLNLKEKGMVKELLSPALTGGLEMLLVNIEPGGSSGPEHYTHRGEEGGLVLAGTLELWVEDRRFTLREGDSFGFESHRPHRFANPGTETTKVLWVVAPPVYKAAAV